MKLLIEDTISIDVESSSTLFDLAKNQPRTLDTPIVLARVDNRLVDLWYKPVRDCRINFVPLNSIDGIRSYRHSLVFLLLRAFHELYPEFNVIVAHSLGRAFYCRVEGQERLTRDMLFEVENRMRRIVEADERFDRTSLSKAETADVLRASGREDKLRLIKWINQETFHLYSFGELKDYFFMPLVPSSGYLQQFALELYQNGLLLRFPRHSAPTEIEKPRQYDKLFKIFEEYERWGEILEINDIGHLNESISNGTIKEMIQISEALHEKKIAYIADQIGEEFPKFKLILIAGPSSSGKTTFSKRLSVQLRVNKITPQMISIDDYFVPRSETPRLENGDFDYENIRAIDIQLFNDHLQSLFRGELVELPKYDFATGRRGASGKKIQLGPKDVLIVEGIHGLNDELTPDIPKELKFKIYVSALTQLNIDDHNRFSTTDTRLIRRLVRDSHFRYYTALETLRRWPLVHEGEDRWIFPHQENADVMFNSALIFEQAVLKSFALPALLKIPRTEPEYSEARRLIDLLSCFLEISTAELPSTSILREFVGGSSFRY